MQDDANGNTKKKWRQKKEVIPVLKPALKKLIPSVVLNNNIIFFFIWSGKWKGQSST